MNCDILKSKLILCEWNAFYFIKIAFIGFTLQEIKQCIVFLGTLVSFLEYHYKIVTEILKRRLNICRRYTLLCVKLRVINAKFAYILKSLFKDTSMYCY